MTPTPPVAVHCDKSVRMIYQNNRDGGSRLEEVLMSGPVNSVLPGNPHLHEVVEYVSFGIPHLIWLTV